MYRARHRNFRHDLFLAQASTTKSRTLEKLSYSPLVKTHSSAIVAAI